MVGSLKEVKNAKALPQNQHAQRHRLKIGQLVYYHPKNAAWSRHEGLPWPYQIIRLLPATEDGEFQYEIRSTLEEHDRVARESELARN
jgi:hypothetical protein